MCGIAALCGPGWNRSQLSNLVDIQRHRGPDDCGILVDASGTVGFAHTRLSVLDLSSAGHQPMTSHNDDVYIVFNGEIYNFVELREELADYPFRTNTDTEVILAAYERWGESCLDRLLGMFAFIIWDARKHRLWAARDRFGVKPLYYAVHPNGGLWLASEIRALHATGVTAQVDQSTWATYLMFGIHDHSERTFWSGISALPAGHSLSWCHGHTSFRCWYDLADRIGPEFDRRPTEEVEDEYSALLKHSVRLRFRSEVPVGINLSGGLDSSILLALVHAVQSASCQIKAFTYITGDARYDELPWVQQMLDRTRYHSVVCQLSPWEVPALAESVQVHQSEPFGGLPSLAYARVFEYARAQGTIVLLDGQGMDEQWAGYDYYASLSDNRRVGLLQGAKQRPVKPECLTAEFRALAEPFCPPTPFPDELRNQQYIDIRYTKIPRALRFNDRISMRSSTELREPFMDHRLMELALRQPPNRKIRDGIHKWLPRRIARHLLPEGVIEAPKRPLQTPQREWLAGPLREWCNECIETAVKQAAGWLRTDAVHTAWDGYLHGQSDNSFYIWQWLNLGLMLQQSS